jgi:hypothetical protein
MAAWNYPAGIGCRTSIAFREMLAGGVEHMGGGFRPAINRWGS